MEIRKGWQVQCLWTRAHWDLSLWDSVSTTPPPCPQHAPHPAGGSVCPRAKMDKDFSHMEMV